MFRHTRDGDIRINEIIYSREIVLGVAPEYMLPVGMSHAEIDVNPRVFDEHGNQFAAPESYLKLVDKILRNLPEIKEVTLAREKAELKKREEEERARQDALPLDIRKQIFYNEQGMTTDRLIRAIVQREFDGDNREMLAIKKERDAVRAREDFPRDRTKKITRE